MHRPWIFAVERALVFAAAGCWTALAGVAAPAMAEAQAGAAQGAYTVLQSDIEDLKAVLATVRSKKVIEARVRTGGTITSLNVTEGGEVAPGEVLAVVVDPKLALRVEASQAQIVALESRLATAKAELDRVTRLTERGVTAQARLDQATTAFEVARTELSAARSERAIIEKQAEEGQVLAPAPGRVLRVPVTVGSVVREGEGIATIAANQYLLRLEVPERHARFMETGALLKVGPRSLGADAQPANEGRIVQVYPEIQNGRVVADAEVDGLGDYFVGERALAWISAGTRKGIVVPRGLTFNRFGLDYVRVAQAKTTIDVVVQRGRVVSGNNDSAMIEVLSGLKPGDRLVQP